MIKIKTKLVDNDGVIQDIKMEYEVKDAEIGEYLSILDKVKNEVLENSDIDEETLKDILFGKED